MINTNIHKRYRFPSEIIQYTVWIYYRFNLSHHDIEDLLAERGINVSYGIAKLTFRHDQNVAFTDFKLLLLPSKTQMHLVSNPDNHWQITDDGKD